MKKHYPLIVLFMITMVAVLVFLYFPQPQKNLPKTAEYRYQFDSASELEDDFWLLTKWGEFKKNTSLATVKDGILTISSSPLHQSPVLITQPFPFNKKTVITLKSKVKISRGDKLFSGGLAVFQTNDITLIPKEYKLLPDNKWAVGIGEGVALVEYSYNMDRESDRPGRDVFRVLAADWELNDNYEIVPPIYDQWIEETLIFDARINQITYMINDKAYKLPSYAIDKNNVRFMMHAYGEENNKIDIDYIEIKVEDMSNKARR